MAADFAGRFAQRRQSLTSLCVGADPSDALLYAWGLPADVGGLSRFVDVFCEAIAGRVAAVKPQVAFFERHGPQGMTELQRFCARLRQSDTLVILDIKRGDIGSSMDAYAAAYLGPRQVYAADAITASAYLGFEALAPAFEMADRSGQVVFVVVSSSNYEGRALQTAFMPDGVTVAERLAGSVAVTPSAGAVCGLSGERDIPRRVLDALGSAPILVPGLGAQGGTCADFLSRFGSRLDRAIPSVGRDILRQGPDGEALRAAIDFYRQELWVTRIG